MSATAVSPDLAEVESRLLARWPETRIAPSLERISRLLDLLGGPQQNYRSVHLTGTNGKTSTARMVEALLAASGHRTGRLTSPHLTSIRERIAVAGQPISEDAFVAAWRDADAQASRVDAVMEHPLSFFEMTVAMGYLAFSRAEVDVAVVEVGMGGRWDATNVIDAEVAVILPIALDHTDYLGPTTVDIAREKAGVIKPGSVAVSARQTPEVLEVLQERADEVGARLLLLDRSFSVTERRPVADGQVITVRGLHGPCADVHLALRGPHQADNAACALAATEAMLGRALEPDAARRALGSVTSPGRLDVHPGRQAVVLDAAHNPHGARALVGALSEIAPDHRRYAVVAVMADKDVDGLLRELAPAVDEIVCTASSSPRSLPADELADIANGIFASSRVHVAADVESALAVARTLPARPGSASEAIVLVTGSVVAVADAERLLEAPATPDRPTVPPLPG
ncbi:MAG TPA: folylpolyglutamate synthase/dihydrofolate synthase family protein [Nocardioides sp.]|nr:folylpolyglutamate synthase/dihydrofolate synthase family protein [Nocardioides sp.]